MQRQSSTATQITSNATDHSYFRVTYKGVVALLQDPASQQKSGSYVAYGELLECAAAADDTVWWKVHAILTGGYAIQDAQHLGYVRPCVVEALEGPPPIVDTTVRLLYKIISTTPLPILTGPMMDAPKTKAVAMPGSVQEISARVKADDGHVWFLKLSHRRGWIMDRKGSTMVVQETELGSHDGASTVATRSTRHRPPRRRRNALPRNVAPKEGETIPSSNVSILSDDSFARSHHVIPHSPESSVANASIISRNTTSTAVPAPPSHVYLMRATRSLKILDAPQFQVNHLIHRNASSSAAAQSSSRFVYDGKSRILPRGTLFETTTPPPDGLLKLADNSGWAVLPKDQGNGSCCVQVGSSSSTNGTSSAWLRIMSRTGVSVACPPLTHGSSSTMTSPTTSRATSDVASSVGSGFLDAVFRTPTKKVAADAGGDTTSSHHHNTTIPCGMCVQVDKSNDDDATNDEYARLCGGQGWIPLHLQGKPTVARLSTAQPSFRFGSFWFRVHSTRGLKVRLGPSKRAPSIKSDDGGEYFRFECGEFLRASEVVVVHKTDGGKESFAKLYRNRHLRLHLGHEEFRSLASLTAQAEWVQIASNEDENYLEECRKEPIIERHRQGWRYNVVPEEGVEIRKGPSFAAEKTGIILFGGEAVVINERVSAGGGQPTWLRMKDGSGWVNEVDDDWAAVMVAHSLRQNRPRKPAKREPNDTAAYNTIIARLFPNESGSSYDASMTNPSSSTDT